MMHKTSLLSSCGDSTERRQEDRLETADDLAALRDAVTLIDGEVLIDGWAAERDPVGQRDLGLVLVTSWRLIFVDVEGAFSALPIAKIDRVERVSPTQVVMAAWYDRMHLRFDSAAAAGAVLNLLRQDSNWGAMEINLMSRPANDIARAGAAPDRPRTDIA
jgi:hypothetical protein